MFIKFENLKWKTNTTRQRRVSNRMMSLKLVYVGVMNRWHRRLPYEISSIHLLHMNASVQSINVCWNSLTIFLFDPLVSTSSTGMLPALQKYEVILNDGIYLLLLATLYTESCAFASLNLTWPKQYICYCERQTSAPIYLSLLTFRGNASNSMCTITFVEIVLLDVDIATFVWWRRRERDGAEHRTQCSGTYILLQS